MTDDKVDEMIEGGAAGEAAEGAVDAASAIAAFPRTKARTLRFQSGAPRSARVIGDGSKALFLRSDGPEDLVTSLWMSSFGEPDEQGHARHYETKLADPRELLADADNEDVPAEEKARRERAREGGAGIVSYSVDAAGRRVVYTINGQLFVTEIVDAKGGEGSASSEGSDAVGDGSNGVEGNDIEARTRELSVDESDDFTPVLNPRISPDGRHVLYSTGTLLIMVDIADWPADNEEAQDAIGVVADVREVVEDFYSGDEDFETDDGFVYDATRAAKIVKHWRIGLAEFVAGEEMDRYDGFWWAPDSKHVIFETFNTEPEPVWYLSDPANPTAPAVGRRYPQALTRNADVHLTLAEFDFAEHGGCNVITEVPIRWDRATYEYVARVNWQNGFDPILLVQDRCQRNDQVLEVNVDFTYDAATGTMAAGATRVLEIHHNDQWIDIVDGTPAFTPDGRLVCALNDMGADTNRLTVNGKAFTPKGYNVRTVLDVTDTDVLAVVQRNPALAPCVPEAWASTASEHDARCYDVASITFDGEVLPLVSHPGVWTASRGAKGEVVSGRTMDAAKTTMIHVLHLPDATSDAAGAQAGATVYRDAAGVIGNIADEPGFPITTRFVELGERGLITAITKPSASSPYAQAEKLPVLLKPYGGPGFQQAVAAQSYHWESQWWADQGFLVVTADGRGTTGRGPVWDRAIFENMKDVTLADQVDAVHALPATFANAAELAGWPQPDLGKVAMIGWSYGGFLSALAVLDAPETVHAGCAGAPPTDWTLYDTHYTERYLGLDPAVYAYNSIVQDAPKLTRPLMIIHGFADDNVTIAHSLRLSQALMAAGRPHTYLPLTGITHMTNDETVAENLLVLQRDFLYDALDLGTADGDASDGDGTAGKVGEE